MITAIDYSLGDEMNAQILWPWITKQRSSISKIPVVQGGTIRMMPNISATDKNLTLKGEDRAYSVLQSIILSRILNNYIECPGDPEKLNTNRA